MKPLGGEESEGGDLDASCLRRLLAPLPPLPYVGGGLGVLLDSMTAFLRLAAAEPFNSLPSHSLQI